MAKSKKKAEPKKQNLEGKFTVIVADPPWSFNDKLTMSDVKRGAASQYPTLTTGILAGLPVSQLAAADALLALWVPSALLEDGMRIMSAWGFTHKGIYTWVKIAKDEMRTDPDAKETEKADLAFGMGRYFRGCTEHALIGVRGKAAALVESHSERNVELHSALPHSAKPEGLQDRLARMFACEKGKDNRLELFARRDKPGWVCVGNEVGDKLDIRDWLRMVLVEKVA